MRKVVIDVSEGMARRNARRWLGALGGAFALLALLLVVLEPSTVRADTGDVDGEEDAAGTAAEAMERDDAASPQDDDAPGSLLTEEDGLPPDDQDSVAEVEPVPIPDEQFDLQVRGLEERVTDLKEKIFQTKARLLLLQETVIGGDLSTGARAVIVHRNEMGGSFVLESVTYILDGAPIFTRVDETGDLDGQKEIEVFNGRLVPGTHQIGVRLVYRGSGYGVFSYLNDYRFRVQSSYTFNAEGGKVTRIDVVGYERGGFTAELQDRPGVRYEEEVTRELPGTETRTVGLDDYLEEEEEGSR